MRFGKTIGSAVLLLTITAAGACGTASSEELAGDESELVSADASQVFEGLSFLDDMVDVTERSAAETKADLSALDASMPPRGELEAWADARLVSSQSLRLRLKDGRSATITARRFSDAPSEQAGKARLLVSVTRVVGPDGESFAYAERLRISSSMRAELFKIEGRRIIPLLRQNSGAKGVDPQAMMVATSAFETTVKAQALARATRSRICTACTMTLQGAKFAGPSILALAGTGGAAAVCTKLGITAAAATAATGPGALVAGGGSWLACNVAFYALGALISTAMLIEGEEGRTNKCSDVADAIGLGRVCDGLAPEECSIGKISQANPTEKCALMGRCARAFHCVHTAAQLCPSLDVTSVHRKTCEEIVDLTCAKPIGLVEPEDFEGPCAHFTTKNAPPP